MSKIIHCSVLLTLIFIATIMLDSPSTAHACSGLSESLEILVDRSEIVIEARVIEHDDRNQNQVLQVIRYLKGNGPEFIILSGNSPSATEALQLGMMGQGGDCRYFRSLDEIGQKAFYHLVLRENGVFVTATFFQPLVMHFDTPRTFPVYNEELTERAGTVDLTEADYLAAVATIAGQEPQHPDETGFYPILSNLLITAIDGSRYVLQPNGVV